MIVTTSSALRVDVADLLRHGGGRREVHLSAPTGELAGNLAAGPVQMAPGADLRIDFSLERVGEGIVARGTVSGCWRAACSRCLGPVERAISVRVDELFEEHPVEGETYAVEGDHIDLEPAVRDNLLVELPAAPHCRDDCRGLCPRCGADLNVASCSCDPDEPDPRWDALRELHL